MVTGPEHSGTGLVARIVRTAFPDALHRAMPHVSDHEIWWTQCEYPEARFVIVHRDREYRNLSTVGRGFTMEQAVCRYELAMGMLARFRPALWVNLEALVLSPETQVGLISDWLGAPLSIPESIYDPDAPFRKR